MKNDKHLKKFKVGFFINEQNAPLIHLVKIFATIGTLKQIISFTGTHFSHYKATSLTNGQGYRPTI